MKFSFALIALVASLAATARANAPVEDIMRSGIPGFFDGVDPGDNNIRARSIVGAPSHRFVSRSINGRYLVNIPRNIAEEARARLAELLGGELTSSITHDWEHIGVAGSFSREVLDKLVQDFPAVDVEQEQEFTLQAAYAGPVTNPASWGLDRVDQAALPLNNLMDTKGLDGTGVRVYVVDTGLYFTQDEYETRAQGATAALNFNAADRANGIHQDCNGHGTHVAGTVLSKSYGVAKNAMLTAIKVLGCRGSGSTADIINGLNAIVTLHPRGRPGVVNMSLGGTGASPTMEAAVRNLITNGLTVVVAAGNENQNACNVSPAREPLAITVAATERTDAKASYSNFGPCVDIHAPGSQIVSTYTSAAGATTATRTALSGTSMASPHVAGVAALILQQNPTFTPAQVTAEILRFATPNVVTGNVAGTVNTMLRVPVYANAVPSTSANPVVPTPPRPPATVVPQQRQPSGVFAYYNATENSVVLAWQADINSTVQCLFLTFNGQNASECFSSSVCYRAVNRTSGEPLLFCSIAIDPLGPGTAVLYAQSAIMDVRGPAGNSYTYAVTPTSIKLNGIETSTQVGAKPPNAGTDGNSGNLDGPATPAPNPIQTPPATPSTPVTPADPADPVDPADPTDPEADTADGGISAASPLLHTGVASLFTAAVGLWALL